MDAATAPGRSYVHSWRKGDVVMWDNRATMHRGRPWPAHEARLMVRTTISATEVDWARDRPLAVTTGGRISARPRKTKETLVPHMNRRPGEIR
jgi:hypothetical protein